MTVIFINLKKYVIDDLCYTLIQRCELLSIMIPRFCFHEKLSIAGNCRMCLVEIKKSLKPVISCSAKVMDSLEVFTNNFFVKKIRENIIELLLINHPLDCPICDQGGECDLQDQTYIYGSDRGRFKEIKRSVFDKNFGPFIKTVMTRCIHCTKCIRFMEEYGDSFLIGTLGRGKETEIGTYVERFIDSELSGNIIDLCPVGALTSKPYAFLARPWELVTYESLDIMDSCCSNILVQVRGNEIMRILPRKNDIINDNWITDNIRFVYDSFKKQRLLVPYTKMVDKSFIPCSWEISIGYLLNNFSYNFFFLGKKMDEFFISVSSMLDVFSSYMVKKFIFSLGIDNIVDSFNNSIGVDFSLRENYMLLEELYKIEYNNFFIVLGVNLKKELPILNLRIKKASHRFLKNTKIIYFGTSFKLDNVFHFGYSINSVFRFIFGKHFLTNIVSRTNKLNIFSLVDNSYSVSKLINLFISNSSNYLVLMDVGSIINNDIFLRSYMSKSYIGSYVMQKLPSFSYFIGIDKIFKLNIVKNNSFFFFQGSNFSEDIVNFNLFFPSCNFTEKTSYYINLEGRTQICNSALTMPGSSLSDDRITYLIMVLFLYKSKLNINRWFYYISNFRLRFPYTLRLNKVSIFFVIKKKISCFFFNNKNLFTELKNIHNKNLLLRISSNLIKSRFYIKSFSSFNNI